ncbi:MAG: LPXTG cell wall anchor domain-containing protein [Enterococcus hulanensis]
MARNTVAKSLPKTGETRTSSYLLAGISVLIFAIGLLLFNHKKAKQ